MLAPAAGSETTTTTVHSIQRLLCFGVNRVQSYVGLPRSQLIRACVRTNCDVA